MAEIILSVGAAAGTPGADQITLYAREEAGVDQLFWKNDAGTEYPLNVSGYPVLAGLTAGQVLRATEATAAAFGALDLANANAVTGTLPVGRGGTGNTNIYGTNNNFTATQYINDTSNANMTLGVTINQGAADDEALALKSSDVAHGVTTVTETDTYGLLRKIGNADGGIRMVGVRGGTATSAALIQAYAAADDTAKSTSGIGPVVMESFKISGTGGGAPGANANIFAVRSNGVTKFIVDQEGDLHVDGSTTITAFDEHHDIGLIRALEKTLSRGAGIVEGAWDSFVSAHRDELEAIGIISQDNFVNVTRLQRLQNGALWQLFEQVQSVRAMMDGMQQQLQAIETRLLA